MLSTGSEAPSFRFDSSEGGTVGLDDLAGKIAVLYFYPRDNTPGCTIEAQDFRDHLSAFAAAGASVFGISRDSIASHCKFRDKYHLTFPLLSDGDGAAMAQYQAWGEKVLYGKKITGVLRSTVVIDRSGRVARHWPKVSIKGHAAEVLAFVQGLPDGGGKKAGPIAAPRTSAKATAKKPPAKPAKKPPAKPAKKPPAKPAKKPPAKPAKKPPAKPAKKPSSRR
jgi:thioredoxin-dependent peroxiredoxin